MKKTKANYHIGMLVRHKLSPAFGIGEILNTNGNQLTIDFGQVGIKDFDATIAPLEILPASDRKSHLALLKGLFHEYRFEDAESYYRANKEFIDENEYIAIEGQSRLKQQQEKKISIRNNIESLLDEYSFCEAHLYYQENKEYIDWNWYTKTEAEYRKKHKDEKIAYVRHELKELLCTYKFNEADNYAQDNKEYVEWQWYSDKKNIYHNRLVIEQLLKSGQFYEADRFYSQHDDCFSRQEFMDEKAINIEKYASEKIRLDYSLDSEQSKALAEIADNAQVTARAGAGKTTVLTCKGMMLATCGYAQDPNSVLMLAFNKEAAEEIRQRIQIKHRIPLSNIRTFHSLAHRIVQPTQEISEDYESQMADHLKTLLKDHPNLKSFLYEFFKTEMESIERCGLLLDETEYYEFAKNCWQSISLGHDYVKSFGEKCIADFLFEHNLNYEYEDTYLFYNNAKQKEIYKPDFTIRINKTNRKFILEHWAIPEQQFYSDQPIWNNSEKTERQYADERIRKRKYWETKKPDKEGYTFCLIETDISWLSQGREKFERRLKRLLESNGIVCNKLPEKELLEKVYKNHSNRLFRLFVSFIQKCRRNGYSPAQIKDKRDQYSTGNPKEEAFLKVAPEIYEKYEKSLNETGRLDFDRLIHLAVDKIRSTRGECCICDNKNNVNIKIKDIAYILIDEFQDFSKLFYDMISAIRDVNPTVKLFCVGDDWQAINGFAGSDLKYYHHFTEDYPDAAKRNVLTNYRSGGRVVEAGNRLMYGLGERSISTDFNRNKGSVEIVEMSDYVIEGRDNQADTGDYQQDQRYMNVCEIKMRNREGLEWKFKDFDTAKYFKAIHQILREHLDILAQPNTNCLILTRTNRFGCCGDSGQLKDKLCNVFSEDEKNIIGQDRLKDKIQVMTAHKSKGKEADIVFILKCNLRTFPMNHPDNRLFGIFGETEQKIFEEERRLFYVALTRAKKKVFLLTEKEKRSPFLRRLQ